MLSQSDYGFLERFLDVTKANMFFARGLLVVEGDAENILLPTLARLIGRDFTENGVSIVNVGGTGLRRFARIYLRRHPDQNGTINVPVACMTDFDVMPNCAPEIVGRVKPGEDWPDKKDRRWRARKDFTQAELQQRRQDIRAKASGQHVETFVAEEWTLEYDLAFFGLARDVWIAAHLAQADEQINADRTMRYAVAADAARSFAALSVNNPPKEELASRVYALFARNSALSKATSAQYLACLLEARKKKGQLSAAALRSALPPYLVSAIDYVTIQDADDGGPGEKTVQNREEAVP
jgi:putative ATP-dependent endonuclease of OLD family